MRQWLLALGCLVATVAHADSIVPVSVQMGNSQFSGAEQKTVEVPLLPPNAVALMGWTAWAQHTSPLPLYVLIEVWHDGGQPHLMHHYADTASPIEGTRNGEHRINTLPPVIFPIPGHRMDSNDRLFMKVNCFPALLPGRMVGGCDAFVTFYVLVRE